MLKDHFFKEGRLEEEHALFILQETTEMLKQEANLVDVKSPVTSTCHLLFQYLQVADYIPSMR